MAIDDEDLEDDDEDLEDEEDEKKKKTKKKPPGSRKPATPAAKAAAAGNGGPRVMPPKPKGAPKATAVRSFKAWVSNLAHRELPPSHFVCELESGDEKKVPLQRNRTGSKFLPAECIATIETYKPLKVEAIFVDEDDEEMSLGQWLFPREDTPDGETTTSAGIVVSTPVPGFTPDENDTDENSRFKLFAHLMADAYRYNAEANKGMLDSMARVMEMQANAFAKERESMTRAMQAAEKTARIKAQSKFRVASGVANASDASPGSDHFDGEDEPEQDGNSELMKVMFDAAGREFAKKFTQAAEGAPSTGGGSGGGAAS
jgi:hypothetical protein